MIYATHAVIGSFRIEFATDHHLDPGWYISVQRLTTVSINDGAEALTLAVPQVRVHWRMPGHRHAYPPSSA